MNTALAERDTSGRFGRAVQRRSRARGRDRRRDRSREPARRRRQAAQAVQADRNARSHPCRGLAAIARHARRRVLPSRTAASASSKWPALADARRGARGSAHPAAWAAWTQHRALLGSSMRWDARTATPPPTRRLKDGREVGWGEGRCNRGEKMWMDRDDYARHAVDGANPRSGPHATPAAPLASSSISPATPRRRPEEEMPAMSQTRSPALPYGPEGDASADAAAVAVIEGLYPINGAAFVRFVNQQFGTEHLPGGQRPDGIHAIQWALGDERMRRTENETSTESEP